MKGFMIFFSNFSDRATLRETFTPKKRSLLTDEAIDDLIFEKGYFENEAWTYL